MYVLFRSTFVQSPLVLQMKEKDKVIVDGEAGGQVMSLFKIIGSEGHDKTVPLYHHHCEITHINTSTKPLSCISFGQT